MILRYTLEKILQLYMKIILLKTGVNMVEDNSDYGTEHNRDEDLYYAYMKSMIDDKKKLRKFCRERGVGTASKYENYEMVNRIQEQSQKIDQLNRVLSDMMSYEPDKHQISTRRSSTTILIYVINLCY